MHSLVAFTTTMLYFVPPISGASQPSEKCERLKVIHLGSKVLHPYKSDFSTIWLPTLWGASVLLLWAFEGCWRPFAYDAPGSSVCFSSYFFHFLSVFGFVPGISLISLCSIFIFVTKRKCLYSFKGGF